MLGLSGGAAAGFLSDRSAKLGTCSVRNALSAGGFPETNGLDNLTFRWPAHSPFQLAGPLALPVAQVRREELERVRCGVFIEPQAALMTEGVVIQAALEGQLKQAAGRDVDGGRHHISRCPGS